MRQPNRQPAYAILLTMFASLTGLALLIRRRWQATPTEGELTPEAAPPETAVIAATPAPAAARRTPVSRQRTLSISVILLLAFSGYAALTLMQLASMNSRDPIMPLVGLISGFVLVNPLYTRYERQWRSAPEDSVPLPVATGPRLRNRFLYWASGLFFTVWTLVLAQLGNISLMLVAGWLLGSLAFGRLLLNGQALAIRELVVSIGTKLNENRQIVLLLAGLSLVALVLPLSTPNLHDDPVRMLVNLAALMALVPLAYLLGRAGHDRWTGLIAAAFSAVSLWALALSKQPGLDTLLAVSGGVYVLGLLTLLRTHDRRASLIAGVGLAAAGWLYPLVLVAFPLLPLAVLITERRRPDHSRLSQAHQVLSASLFTLVLAAPALNGGQIQALLADNPAEAIPLINQLQPAPPPREDAIKAPNPQLSWLEGTASSLLLFNLTSDPNPLHGIVNRPVLSPAVSAAFLLGALGLAWRIYARPNWADALLLAALVLLLIPAGYNAQLPVRYPNLLLAAPVLPLVLVIAASGLVLPLRLLVSQRAKAGLAIALMIIGLVVVSAFIDAQGHYQNVFYPVYASLSD